MLEKDNSGSQGSSFLFTTTATTTIPRAPKKLYRATLTSDSLHKSGHIINIVINYCHYYLLLLLLIRINFDMHFKR